MLVIIKTSLLHLDLLIGFKRMKNINNIYVYLIKYCRYNSKFPIIC